MSRPLHFSAFVMNTASHITHGLWRDPAGGQIAFNDLGLWIDLATRLEAGGFDVMFFADVVGLYGDYQGGWAHHAELGLQIPSNDPMVILSALASHTERLGLAFTAGSQRWTTPPTGGSPGTSSPARLRTPGATSATTAVWLTTAVTSWPRNTSTSSTSCGRARGTTAR
jgi:hypothetical protein